MESRAVAVSCGQMGAASCLLCIVDILAQWAVSTPRHSIHMGQQAKLQTPLSVIPSLSSQTNGLFCFFLCTLLQYFEVQPVSLTLSGKIPVRKFFMAQLESH